MLLPLLTFVRMRPFNQPYTVFYTDDDADDRELFREVLAEMESPYNLHTQTNGGELLEQLHNPPPEPHLVFLDLNMPVKNGFDALAEMRRSEKYKNTPVIIFTTSDDANDVDKARHLGADMFITKPKAYDRFRQVLQDVLTIDWLNDGARSFQFRTF